MFTGLIEEIGTVKSVIMGASSARITIEAHKILKDVKLGDSISINGVCLTVTSFSSNEFTVDVMPETMRKTNLKYLRYGSKVNLERALSLGARLGGHIVTGHIDGVGIIKNFKDEDNAVWVTIEAPDDVLKYIVYKGSIAIDGISLTVAYVDNEVFKVSIIPLTRDKTTLLSKKIGEEVNLECDIIGKYVEKYLEKLYPSNQSSNKGETISIEFLKQNGFL
jgi:riboflavin synthase